MEEGRQADRAAPAAQGQQGLTAIIRGRLKLRSVECRVNAWRCEASGQGSRLKATRLRKAMGRRYHYHVYVIELSKDVLYEGRFKKSNPDYIPGKPCVYVGMTGLDPDVRFDKHKAGIQSNRYVQEFGLRLLPDLYRVYNPMPYDGARDMEVELAIGLREAGYGVWQA